MRLKRILYIFIGLATLLTLLIFLYESHRSSISKPYIIEETLISLDLNNPTIALLGDSWVYKNSLDNALTKVLGERKLDYSILSFGEPGAFSKKIYQNLNTKDGKFSAFTILQAKPQYCIVIAGVNDAASQIGADFYAKHMELIVRKLLEGNIKPVIIELPEFGIHETINNAHFLARAKNTLMAWVNNGGETDNIKQYREALSSILINENFKGKITYIPFDSVCTDYNTCLSIFKDPAHLNEKGKAILCETIVQHMFN